MTPTRSCQNVLLIEDDAGDVQAVRSAMQAAGFHATVTVMNTGRTALDYLRMYSLPGEPGRPDLILLDLTLPIPGPDGRDVLAEVKGDPGLRSIPLVILTGSRDPGDIGLCYQLGANAYLQKPNDFAGYVLLMERVYAMWCLQTAAA